MLACVHSKHCFRHNRVSFFHSLPPVLPIPLYACRVPESLDPSALPPSLARTSSSLAAADGGSGAGGSGGGADGDDSDVEAEGGVDPPLASAWWPAPPSGTSVTTQEHME